ncbi:MAG TPA: methyltransferase domain-containing protein [Caldisericia bacterium]|nr:methyltransferase domain-containing protein [Caldisericia bacterium]HPF49527.1 methyltransferase domain-containing protein [Caldisericia bacterium]HPI84179.1 methyltransferase domain-containing protein [Caldisericia bacterium]HPQ93526.1 methyltransferase domain-containing protein [Caldisericia bacterium]HRV75468.1 methyltransferase domain-containing protein [Caldisericia bacterium]
MSLFDGVAGCYDAFFDTRLGKAVLHYELQLIMKMLDPKSGLSTLDAGCGTGVFTEQLVKSGMTVTGFDESEKMLEVASKKPDLKRTKFLKGDIHNLPFEDASFDRVLCAFVVEFLENPKTAIREFWRVLKPGGVLVVATLNSKGAWADSRKADPFWHNATFRTDDELLALGPTGGAARHCVFFPPTTKVFFGVHETLGRCKGSDEGAAVIARWVR